MNTAVSTEKAPAAIGPYSQAVQAGNTVYVSGQLPIDPATGAFAGEDIRARICPRSSRRRCFSKTSRILLR